jgi:hypothetical protein
MEEILASIRRIISEDDAPAAEAEAAHAAPAAPANEPEPSFEAAHEPADDVLELTERVNPPAESVGDIDVYPKEPAPAPAPPPQMYVREEEESLVSEPTAFAAASAFGQLSASIALPAPGRTLEDLTRELLRPLLKAWLDEHLPRIVEQEVAKEVERIARSRVR